MKYEMQEPCNECPYVGKWKGWIGAHETAQDFVDVVRNDQPFPCHKSVPSDTRSFKERAMDAQQCAGYALFMSRMCKISRHAPMMEMQRRLKANPPKEEVLYPPQKLVDWHDKEK